MSQRKTRVSITLSELVLSFVLAILTVSIFPPPARAELISFWQQKVEAELLAKAEAEEIEFLVYLAEQADLSHAVDLPTKLARGRYVYTTLTGLAARTQPSVVAALEAEGARTKRFWIANLIWARGSIQALETVARLQKVQWIYGNWPIEVEKDVPIAPGATLSKSPSEIEWNISLVSGPDVWAEGNIGQGGVIGGIDTGYDWDHPALINQYRGWNGGAADHNYHWHDAIHSGGGSCGPDSPEPCDDGSHGTHTMGIMVGDDGGANQIGLAPGARWIGCRCMDVGFGTPASYTECLQWMVAPTDLNDQNPNPDLAPDAINNSWVCPENEGCVDPDVLRSVVENVRAAGIFVVASAGNNGSDCASVQFPLAIYDAVFSVGSTDFEDIISGFSSRGPVIVDGSDRLKPDIVAPGQGVRSCIPGDDYASMSGTSMAGPHVAALVALLVTTNPDFQGHVDQLENFIRFSAVPMTHPFQNCGGVSGQEVPNNTYGFGRIDAYAAHLLIDGFVVDTPDAAVPPLAMRLLPNHPNPFNPTTVIRYELPTRSVATLTVYDLTGRRVRLLVQGKMQAAGGHDVTWNGRNDHGRAVPSGVYIYRLEANGERQTRRMALVR